MITNAKVLTKLFVAVMCFHFHKMRSNNYCLALGEDLVQSITRGHVNANIYTMHTQITKVRP
jgi:hypothetical protein